MENQNIQQKNVRELAQAWRSLHLSVVVENKMSYDEFSKTFSETYSLLKGFTEENHIDKEYVELIANAYCFSNLPSAKYENKIGAAFVLTERMLKYCTMDSNACASAEGVTVYFMEDRKDVFLDFNNVDRSIAEVMSVIEANYWKKMSK